jgi:DNA-binding response OmpR family regulator
MSSGVRTKVHVVLLVEDDADLLELYGNAMRDAGLLVDEVVTVAEAIVMAERLRPDIVVLDRRLPDGDGWNVARALKASASETTRRVPIIAFTSHRERADVEGALVAGCDAFLEKGCAPEALIRHVRGMLGLPLVNTDVYPTHAAGRSRRSLVS